MGKERGKEAANNPQHMHARTHTHTHACKHTYTRAHTHTRTHTHTHAHGAGQYRPDLSVSLVKDVADKASVGRTGMFGSVAPRSVSVSIISA